jgi:hypothetical protein
VKSGIKKTTAVGSIPNFKFIKLVADKPTLTKGKFWPKLLIQVFCRQKSLLQRVVLIRFSNCPELQVTSQTLVCIQTGKVFSYPMPKLKYISASS